MRARKRGAAISGAPTSRLCEMYPKTRPESRKKFLLQDIFSTYSPDFTGFFSLFPMLTPKLAARHPKLPHEAFRPETGDLLPTRHRRPSAFAGAGFAGLDEGAGNSPPSVMPGLVPGIHAHPPARPRTARTAMPQDVDARNKSGHDDRGARNRRCRRNARGSPEPPVLGNRRRRVRPRRRRPEAERRAAVGTYGRSLDTPLRGYSR